MEVSMSNISTLVDGVMVGQTKEFVDGKDIILDGSYVKANGQLLDKTEYTTLHSVAGDTTSSLDGFIISSSSSGTDVGVYGRSIDSPSTVVVDGKFITVGTMESYNVSISVSSSDDGESWTVPSYSIPSSDQFRSVRAFSTGLFIVTGAGVYKSVDYGVTFVKVYASSDARDIAFDGVSTYVVSGDSLVAYYGNIEGIMTSVSVLTTGASSVVWDGTNFIRVCSNSNSSYRSPTGVTWAANASLAAPYGSVAVYGNRIFLVNGNLVVFLSNTKTFAFSTNSGVSWTSSSSSIVSCTKNIIWDGSSYIYCSGTSGTTTHIHVCSTLNATPTTYSVPTTATTTNIGQVSYNGSKYLYEVVYAGVGYINVSPTAPSADVTIDKCMGRIYSGYTTMGGGNTLSANIRLVNDTSYLGLYKYSNGLFTPIKYSPTQYYHATGTSSSGFYHYAKDAKVLYYTKNALVNSVPLFRREFDIATGVFGPELSAANMSLSANTAYNNFRHSNGVFSFNTGGNSTAFIGKSVYNASHAASTFCSVTADGNEIFMVGTSPFPTIYSNNGGKSFISYTAACYGSTGGLITATATTAALIKLGSKYYSANGSLEGDTPFVLTYKIGIPTFDGAGGFYQVITDYLACGESNIELYGNNMVTSPQSLSYSIAPIMFEDGSIHIKPNELRMYKSPILDATKFKVKKFYSDSVGKAIYIKAK